MRQRGARSIQAKLVRDPRFHASAISAELRTRLRLEWQEGQERHGRYVAAAGASRCEPPSRWCVSWGRPRFSCPRLGRRSASCVHMRRPTSVPRRDTNPFAAESLREEPSMRTRALFRRRQAAWRYRAGDNPLRSGGPRQQPRPSLELGHFTGITEGDACH